MVSPTTARGVWLTAAAPATPAVRLALQALTEALQARDAWRTAPAPEATTLVTGLPGDAVVTAAVAGHPLALPSAPEAVMIHWLPVPAGPARLLVTGGDARGQCYALREVARAIRLTPPTEPPLARVLAATETPALRYRAVSLHLHHAAQEAPWYFAPEFWAYYSQMLMAQRFNTLLLTFGDQTNYLAPPFPWLFHLPDFPAVQIEGLSDAERARNLAMLRRISELVTEAGLDFGVAIWQQQPVLTPGAVVGPFYRNYGPTALRHLPSDPLALAEYGRQGLARLLQECPSIRRLQLRANYESGIPESAQHSYFSGLFAQLARQSPPVALELRYKGLEAATLAQAREAGLDLWVSTKFWCEHLGLPFHPTAQDPLYSASRYGFGQLLRQPRAPVLCYQLWNQGSSRLLLWGDPAYASRFAQSCQLADGEGFEIAAPLTNRGWGNSGAPWRLWRTGVPDDTQWEQERYWPTYLAFGRYGYQPSTPDSVWEREFEGRLGAVGTALQVASGILPLLTATAMTSASEWTFWPEMDLGGDLDTYAFTPPSDYAQFYGIRAWQASPKWQTGAWSREPRGYLEDALADTLEAKWTPWQIADELDRLASTSLAHLPAAATPPAEREAAAMIADITALACLARYHAAKKRAATHLAFFRVTGDAGRLPAVLSHATAALAAWEALVAATADYHHDLIFGRSMLQVGPPDRPVNAHAGHWRDRLPQVHADLALARELLAIHGPGAQPVRRYPGEPPLAAPPQLHHTPMMQAVAGQDLALVLQVTSALPIRQAWLHYRAMDQTCPWLRVPLLAQANGDYLGVLPGSDLAPDCPRQYYFEVRVAGGGSLWPDWRRETPYIRLDCVAPSPTPKTAP